MKIFALYKGEKLLATGTKLQIAYQLGVKYKTIKFYNTPIYKRRCKNSKSRRELVELT